MSMPRGRYRLRSVTVVVLLLVAASAKTDAVHYPFTGPVFGLALAPDGSLLATDAGAGMLEESVVVRLRRSLCCLA